ncbi:hypothetical protein CEXT_351531 [Caerostris extrusa]|uniref:Uncharacterized protein n=1 Tax=Caerostris extrusa TaxID=172846 RepID=A0AAV4XNL4_CAEEX|nr:hypothetical protein CEXT_351531 [Caerostris extrusa]
MSCFPPVARQEEKKSGPRCFSTKNPPQTCKKGEVLFECSELFVLSRRRAISSIDHKIRTSQQGTTDVFPTTTVYLVRQTDIFLL